MDINYSLKKVLLTGKSEMNINNFFFFMEKKFNCISTSTREEDLIIHINDCKPDLLVYCMENEKEEEMKNVISLRNDIDALDIPLVIIGNKVMISEFNRLSPGFARTVIELPVTINHMQDEILKLLDDTNVGSIMSQLNQEISQAIIQTGSPINVNANAQTGNKIKANTLSENNLVVKGSGEKKRSYGATKHILVIDDDPRMLKVVKGQMDEEYDVATAISGKIAFKFLQRHSTDLILLDYEMPEENGPEVLKKLRENQEWAKIPVVFLTGVDRSDVVKKVLDMKPQGYLLKPIDHQKLIATVKRLIG